MREILFLSLFTFAMSTVISKGLTEISDLEWTTFKVCIIIQSVSGLFNKLNYIITFVSFNILGISFFNNY